MRFNIYRRFHIEIRREHDLWVVYRSEMGKRTPMTDVVIPQDLAAHELATYLDDIFHEYAAPWKTIEVMPEQAS